MKRWIISVVTIILVIVMFIIVFNEQYHTEFYLKALIVVSVILVGLVFYNTKKR